MKVLVTGGAGFIGSKTVNELVNENYKVIVLDNLSTGSKENLNQDAEFIYGDIVNYEIFKSIGKVDVVIHLAAKTSVTESIKQPSEYEKVNVIGTINVLEYMKESQIKKIIFSSSAAVYGDTIKIPISEEQPLDPLSPYALSKVTAEEYIKLYNRLFNINYTIFRYFNVIGDGQNIKKGQPNVYTIFKDRIAKGMPLIIYGDGSQIRDFIKVETVAKLNAIATKIDIDGIFNLGSGKGTKIIDLAKEVIRDSNTRIKFMPKRKGEIQASVADITKIKEALKRNQIDFNNL